MLSVAGFTPASSAPPATTEPLPTICHPVVTAPVGGIKCACKLPGRTAPGSRSSFGNCDRCPCGKRSQLSIRCQPSLQ
jgi:hypothetical protein